jgi:hypothetical protein
MSICKAFSKSLLHRNWAEFDDGAFECDHEPMDITKMLAELKAEREGVEQAILVLERIAAGRSKRRGRPPAWMSQVKKRGRPPGTKNKPKEE